MLALRPWMIPAVLSRRRGVTWAQFFSGRVGAVWDPRLLSQMSTSRTGGTFGTVLGDTVGFVVDQARGGTAALGADLRSSGTITTVGAPAEIATFNTSTGAGRVYRTNSTNTSSVLISVPANKTVLIDIERTSGAAQLQIRSASAAGALLASTITTRATYAVTAPGVANIVISTDTNFDGCNFTCHSVRELPGIHMVAPTDARRATLVGYAGGSVPSLYANGAHGYASSAALDLSGSDEVTVIMQVRKLSDAAAGMLCEFGAGVDSINGTFAVSHSTFVTSGTRTNYAAWSRNTGTITRGYFGYTQPHSAIIAARIRLSAGQSHSVTINGTTATASETSGSDGSARNLASATVNWMARNLASPTLLATAEFGTTAIIGGALSTDDLATAVALAAY